MPDNSPWDFDDVTRGRFYLWTPRGTQEASPGSAWPSLAAVQTDTWRPSIALAWLDADYRPGLRGQQPAAQTLFEKPDVCSNLCQAIAATRRIAAFNSQVVVEPKVADLTPSNVEELLGEPI